MPALSRDRIAAAAAAAAALLLAAGLAAASVPAAATGRHDAALTEYELAKAQPTNSGTVVATCRSTCSRRWSATCAISDRDERNQQSGLARVSDAGAGAGLLPIGRWQDRSGR